MRKSKSCAPSRSGAACADTAEDCDGCFCDVDTPGAGDSCAADENKLSCIVASKQIEYGFIGLTRQSRATAGPPRRVNCSERGKHRELLHKTKCGLHSGQR